MKNRLIHAIVGAAFAALLAATAARAQAPPAEAQSPLAPQSEGAFQLKPQRLAQMLAPIALYPDGLLGDILMAATYPLDVVEAARWVEDPHNAQLKGDRLLAALKEQDWDPSVKALASFPSILRMMDRNLEWTERLGEAFLADPKEVMDAVQRLRRRAQSAGHLISTPEEIVRTEEVITIEPASPEIVYAPICDPSVYGAWPYPAYPPYSFPAFFGGATAGALGCGWVSWPIFAPIFVFNRLDFRKHRIDLDRDRFALLNKNRGPIGGEEWRHDPFRRGNVPYRDAALVARFGGPTQMQGVRRDLRGYPIGPLPRADAGAPPRTEATPFPRTETGPLPRIDRPFAATWPERGLVPGTERSMVRRSIPSVFESLPTGAQARIPQTQSTRGFPARTWAPNGGGHYVSPHFSPLVVGGARAPMAASPIVGGMRGR